MSVFERLRMAPDDTLLSELVNRDQREFDCAETLDLTRDKPGHHLGFGSGVHFFLGAPLARREMYWACRALIDRVDDMWFALGKK